MAKEIGVKINFQSTGEQKVINNLKELETELGILQTELKSLDFGSDAFNKATKDISNLRSQIDAIDKATEGIGAEKKFRALGDAIGVATGSFQVLSGILGLVITNTESLEEVQKAEAQALQVLNVALGINAINTALVESATLRATLAQKANTIATNIASKAQAAWNLILSLNPIGVVVAAVVGLTAAIYGLVRAYEVLFGAEGKQAKQIKEINNLENELIKTKRESSKELEFQLTILTDTINTRALERKTLEDLKKTYPGLNAFIDKNNKLTQEGIEFLKLEIQLRKDQAALNAVQSKLVEKEIEFEEEAAKIRQKYGASAKILIEELKEDYDENIKPITIVQERYTKALDDTLLKLQPYQKKIQEQVGTEKELVKVQREQVAQITARTKLLQGLTKLINQQDAELKKLLATELEYTADVLEIQKEIIQDQTELLERRNEVLVEGGEKLSKQAEDLFLTIIPTDEVLDKTEDKFKELFDNVGDAINLGVIDYRKEITEGVLEGVLAEEDLQNFRNLTKDSQQTLLDFFNELKDRADQINKVRVSYGLERIDDLDLVREISNVEDDTYDAVVNRLQTGKTLVQIQKENLKILEKGLGFEEISKKLNSDAEKSLQRENKLNRDLEASKDEQVRLQNQLNATTDEATKKQLQKEIALQENRQNNLQLQITSAKEEKTAAQEALAAFKEFEDTQASALNRSIDFYKGVEVITDQANEGFEKIKENAQAIKREFSPEELQKITNFFTENIENIDDVVFSLFNNLQRYRDRLGEGGVEQVLQGISGGIKELGVESEEGLETSRKYLETYILIGEALGYNVDEAKNLLDVINDQLNDIQLENAFDKLDNFTQKITQTFNQVATQFQNLLQSQTSLLLEGIAADEAAALKAVEGFTAKEEAVRKDFAKKRFDVEKASRIQEIKFSIAQLITDTAGAITNTLANVPTPFNIPLAGVIGGLGAAQVLQAQSQLTFVQAQQFVGRRGGMIVGQSHEGSNGGVPALLEGGEFVVNKAAVAQYGDLIGELNSSTGGRRLAIDDSRLVQTIASQNQNTPPLKAYVLYNDIQSTDKLNSRITKLARL